MLDVRSWILEATCRARLPRLAIVAFAGTVLVALSSGSCLNDSTSTEPEATLAPPSGESFGDLYPTGEDEFTVAFSMSTDLGDDGRLVWRQADGVRRLDVLLPLETGDNVSGQFQVERGFETSIVTSADDSAGCIWVVQPETPETPLAICQDAPFGGYAFAPISNLHTSVVEDVLEPRVILGSTADCYQLFHPQQTSEICVDQETGAPLYLDSRSELNGSLRLEALDVSERTSELRLPDTFPVSSLGVPMTIIDLDLPEGFLSSTPSGG